MTADQPRDAAIAALDDLVERWHAWDATDDPDLKVMLGLGLMQDAFDALPSLAALAPADPTADPRADIEHRARMQDALDALMQATLWVHRTVDMPREPKSWDSKARSGIVGLRAALAASTTEDGP